MIQSAANCVTVPSGSRAEVQHSRVLRQRSMWALSDLRSQREVGPTVASTKREATHKKVARKPSHKLIRTLLCKKMRSTTVSSSSAWIRLPSASPHGRRRQKTRSGRPQHEELTKLIPKMDTTCKKLQNCNIVKRYGDETDPDRRSSRTSSTKDASAVVAMPESEGRYSSIAKKVASETVAAPSCIHAPIVREHLEAFENDCLRVKSIRISIQINTQSQALTQTDTDTKTDTDASQDTDTETFLVFVFFHCASVTSGT